MAYPKIVYPSMSALPNQPAVSPVVAGAFGARTYYFLVTLATVYGESLPCAEFSVNVAANSVPSVASPDVPLAPTVATGWNLYASLGAGAEKLQVAAVIDMGTAWTLPLTGLVDLGSPPDSWGATLSFLRQPPRFLPYSSKKSVRSDQYATSGVSQTVTERVDEFIDFKMEVIDAGADVLAWDQFLDQALRGIPFDYYPDASVATFTTYKLIDMDSKLVYKSPSLYSFECEFRQELQQVTPPPGIILPIQRAARWVTFTAAAAGNFTLAHGLGFVPHAVGAPIMTSAGVVWFQSTMFDASNLYLVASAPGLTGMVLVW